MQSQEKAISWTEGFRGYTVPMIVLKENYFSLTFAHYLVNYVLLVLRAVRSTFRQLLCPSHQQ
jgi:hypothetical protein